MSRTKKISAVVLAIIIIVSVSLPVDAIALLIDKVDSAITTELQKILETTEKDDKIPVDICCMIPYRLPNWNMR